MARWPPRGSKLAGQRYYRRQGSAGAGRAALVDVCSVVSMALVSAADYAVATQKAVKTPAAANGMAQVAATPIRIGAAQERRA